MEENIIAKFVDMIHDGLIKINIPVNIIINIYRPDKSENGRVSGDRRVYQIYKQILDRKPDSVGLVDYSSLLRRGEKTVKDIVKNIGQSNEFIRLLDSKSRSDAIDTCYWRFLGRRPDPGGKAHYMRELEKNPDYRWFVESLVDSPEYARKFKEKYVPHKSSKVM